MLNNYGDILDIDNIHSYELDIEIYSIVFYCIVLYCIVLYCRIIYVIFS